MATRTRSAHREIKRLSADAGTVFSAALLATREQLLKLATGIRYALFLTDGENDATDKANLGRAVDRCKGLFQCDGRGVGSDWTKADLTFIANTLLGNADIIPGAEEEGPIYTIQSSRRFSLRASPFGAYAVSNSGTRTLHGRSRGRFAEFETALRRITTDGGNCQGEA